MTSSTMHIFTLALLTTVLCASQALASGDFWGVANIGSRHSTYGLSASEKREVDGLSQSNPGLGLEYHASEDVLYLAGAFRNSNRRDSVYINAAWTPLHLGPTSTGVSAGLVTGYRQASRSGILPMAMLITRIESQTFLPGFGANIVVVPPIRATGSYAPFTVGLQVKYNFH